MYKFMPVNSTNTWKTQTTKACEHTWLLTHTLSHTHIGNWRILYVFKKLNVIKKSFHKDPGSEFYQSFKKKIILLL